VIRLALGKGRNLGAALAAFRAAGLVLPGVDGNGRQLRVELPREGFEVLLLKDWDLPLYVEHGVADCGVVGSDVLAEVDGDLLTPVRLADGRCRLSLIGRPGALPRPGSQVRLATKYPSLARRLLAARPWTAEVLALSGSVELAPVLDLAEVALDIVQTGRTLAENGLAELESVEEVAPVLVINRASFHRLRRELNALVDRLVAAGVAA
jgi:ATP phosphoribosyltransferase